MYRSWYSFEVQGHKHMPQESAQQTSSLSGDNITTKVTTSAATGTAKLQDSWLAMSDTCQSIQR
jgi:hypothetical protein